MQQSLNQRPVAAPAVLGLLFIVFGSAALVARGFGLDVFAIIGDWGWPLFMIVPGVVLLVVAFVPAPPAGVGFAVAGAIVTTVGSLLAYQSQFGQWQSWAYAWALLPLAAGIALGLYGLYAHERDMVRGGLWMSGIAAVVFFAGAWFFEGVFAGQVRPDLAASWPVVVIAIGVVVLLRALLVHPSPDARAATGVEQPKER